MADLNIPVPQIDYTSRDYTAIRNDLVNLIDNFAPQWTSRDASDFGIVMIELFSYMGDMLNYYIDRAANEAFLSSATQRETVINIARLLNYTPSNALPASGTVKFFNTNASNAVIPKGTVVATDPDQDGNRVFFETTEDASQVLIGGPVIGTGYSGTTFTITLTEAPDLTAGDSIYVSGLTYTGKNPNGTFVSTAVSTTAPYSVSYTLSLTPGTVTYSSLTEVSKAGLSSIPYNKQTASIGIIQGLSVSQEEIGISDGTPNQLMTISRTPVIQDSTLSVTVGTRSYKYVPHLVDSGIDDEVFSLITDGNGYTYVVFGNGVSGKIPPVGISVYCTYRYGGGKSGNLGSDSLTTLTNGPSGVEVSQESPTYGGADPESTDSIRLNAPTALRSVNRAVSLLDYANLAIQVSGVAKAIAASEVFTSVNLYVACSDAAPLDSNDAVLTALTDWFADKTPPNTTLTINDFTPIYPVIHVEVTTRAGYDSTVVKNDVYKAIVDLLSFDNVSFNDTITQADIQTAAGTYSIPGVQDLKITRFENQSTLTDPTNADGTVTSTTKLVYNIDEIPIAITDPTTPNFILVKDAS